MRTDIYKTVLTDGMYYYRTRSCAYISLTTNPVEAWDFNNRLYDIRTSYCNFLKFELEQFVMMSGMRMVGDKYETVNLDYSKFKLRHIVRLAPLWFEDFDASSEIGIIRELGTPIPK